MTQKERADLVAWMAAQFEALAGGLLHDDLTQRSQDNDFCYQCYVPVLEWAPAVPAYVADSRKAAHMQKQAAQRVAKARRVNAHATRGARHYRVKSDGVSA